MTAGTDHSLPAALADFAGRWRIDRRIEDRLGGREGVFTGMAVLTPADAGLAYEETGDLRFPGAAPMRAERRYLWRAEAGRIVVDFADGRPFHGFPLGEGAAEAGHDCPPDLYRVDYDFGRWPGWRAVWEVTGPRKDYRMVSDYRRE
jgi:hypothetical protein